MMILDIHLLLDTHCKAVLTIPVGDRNSALWKIYSWRKRVFRASSIFFVFGCGVYIEALDNLADLSNNCNFEIDTIPDDPLGVFPGFDLHPDSEIEILARSLHRPRCYEVFEGTESNSKPSDSVLKIAKAASLVMEATGERISLPDSTWSDLISRPIQPYEFSPDPQVEAINQRLKALGLIDDAK